MFKDVPTSIPKSDLLRVTMVVIHVFVYTVAAPLLRSPAQSGLSSNTFGVPILNMGKSREISVEKFPG